MKNILNYSDVKRKSLVFLIFLSCVSYLSAQRNSSQIIDVFLIGGQSNATGQGYMRNIPKSFEVDTTVMFYYSRYLNGGKVATHRTLFEWALEAAERGAGEILFTSMTHDGTRSGYAHEALLELHRLLPIPIIASGGAGTKAHFKDAFLRRDNDS